MKLQTGISTDRDFRKAMKDKGVSVSSDFPAETLRDQLDGISEVNVTFESSNETVLAAVNGETAPAIEEPTECLHENMTETGNVQYTSDESRHTALVGLKCEDCEEEFAEPQAAEEHTFVASETDETKEVCSVCGFERDKAVTPEPETPEVTE